MLAEFYMQKRKEAAKQEKYMNRTRCTKESISLFQQVMLCI